MRIKWMSLFVLAAVVMAFGGQSASADSVRWSNEGARRIAYSYGMTVSSSGGCQDRYNSSCTSLEQIHEHTIRSLIAFKGATGCAINITGGTEVGHASGTYSHWNGYKVDISKRACVDNYITGRYTYIGGNKYRSPGGHIYYNEGDHWDILYYS